MGPGLRMRLTTTPILGRVSEWKGNYGWLEPQCQIEHPDLVWHFGRIFIHAEDCYPKWKKLTTGSLVEFHLYYEEKSGYRQSGLGAEDCVARKVLRLTVPWERAREAFGADGDEIPSFEERLRVSVRAYEWMNLDGSKSDLAFVLFELWGRPNAISAAVLKLSELPEEGTHSADMLVPESRLWKVDVPALQTCGSKVQLSPSLTISDPMPCRTLEITGGKEETSSTLQALIEQICDT